MISKQEWTKVQQNQLRNYHHKQVFLMELAKIINEKITITPIQSVGGARITPHDFAARVRFCHWFNATINNNIMDLTFMSDEAWFYLSGFVNSQNYRTWAIVYRK